MSRYFFDVSIGDTVVPDDVGVDLRDDPDGILEAALGAIEIIMVLADQPEPEYEREKAAVRIRNESGITELEVTRPGVGARTPSSGCGG